MIFPDFLIIVSKNYFIQNGRKYKVCSVFTTSNAESDVNPIVFVSEPVLVKYSIVWYA